MLVNDDGVLLQVLFVAEEVLQLELEVVQRVLDVVEDLQRFETVEVSPVALAVLGTVLQLVRDLDQRFINAGRFFVVPDGDYLSEDEVVGQAVQEQLLLDKLLT